MKNKAPKLTSETPVTPSVKKKSAPSWLRFGMVRGESSVASIGVALSAIVILVLAASGWWTLRTQSQTALYARQQQILNTAKVLAQSAESMLGRGDLTPVRSLMMDIATQDGLERLRIVLPSGDILADNDPALISADLDAAIWQATGTVDSPVIENDGRRLSVSVPMKIQGYGVATLEAQAPVKIEAQNLWEAQAGVGVIGVSSLFALWLVYRHFRSRLAAMGVIRESLLAIDAGEASESALTVSDRLGREAATWNHLLEDRKQLTRQVAVREAKEGMLERRSSNGDLAGGCDAMSQGVILLDENMQVSYTNNAAAVFLGTERKQLLASRLIDWIRESELADVLHDSLMNAKRATYVLDNREGDAVSAIRYTIRPVREGDSACAILMIEDITQQRVAEEARHAFVAQATHELRTPLTNIRLYVETAIDEGDADTALRAKCLNVINQETLRLERMVGDMLSVAEIESGSLHLSHDDVRVDQLINDIEADFSAQAESKDLKFECTIPPKLPVIQGDRDKLVIIMQNLLSNALKYTSDGGHVSVGVEVQDNMLAIEVADTGIGIAPEDQMRIFEKFYRADDKRIVGITGSGLGLALAREIARLHGGDIVLESQVDIGSTFLLTLPIPENSETTATS